MNRHGQRPAVLGQHDVVNDNREPFMYVYLPVKMAGEIDIFLEKRLQIFSEIIGRCNCDFIGQRGLDAFVATYVYVTAKRMFVEPGGSFNREGWHCDGFGTNDLNYIWSDTCPTIMNNSEFNLSNDEFLSMDEMTAQAKPENDFTYPDKTLVRLDQYNVHKVAPIVKPVYRTFIKISYSTDKYDLIGNSHNHEIDYHWEMRERGTKRNVPQKVA